MCVWMCAFPEEPLLVFHQKADGRACATRRTTVLDVDDLHARLRYNASCMF